MRERSTILRSAAALAVALATLASIAVTTAVPAGASSTSTRITQTQPVTWVDDQGRQYVATDLVPAGYDPADPFRLAVIRDLPDGQPDTTWGAGGSNVRLLSLTPPADGATRNDVMAADADGTITLVWDKPGCAAGATCSRWFSQIDATGATVAAPIAVGDVPRLIDALADGSILTGAADDALGWRSPTGTVRSAPAIPAATVRSAAVDGDGRLLVATTDGNIIRWPADGPADITLDSGCSGDEGVAVGASTAADDGFAVACGSTGEPVTVTRYDDDGSVAWTAADDIAPAGASLLERPTDLTITADGAVWVGGDGRHALTPTFDLTITAVASFRSDGAIGREYERPTMRQGNYDNGITGVSELRPATETRVAVADVQRCCSTIAGQTPDDAVLGAIVPYLPVAPTCTEPEVHITAATATSVDVRFTTCEAGLAHAAVTGYRIDATTSAGTVTKAVASTTPSTVIDTTVGGLTPGLLTSVSVTPYNAQGDTTGYGAWPDLAVPPFADVAMFTYRAYTEGSCGALGLAEADAKAAAVAAGTLAPADHIAAVLGSCEAETRVEPIARLYQAAFLRPADTSGLRYWVGRSRAGRQLVLIAAQFARSSEFTRRYGALTDRKFVERIYQNVLGRPGDADGITFWTSRLTTKKSSRGVMLAQFSESAEHVRRTDPQVQPTAAWFLMLGRVPTVAERAQIATFDHPRQDAALAILALPAYAERVAS